MYNSMKYLLTAATIASVGVGCIKDDLDPCPDGGSVEVALRVEKFQTRPPYGPDDLEERFIKRILTCDYLLYSDEGLLERGSMSDVKQTVDDAYLFRHDPLPFGNYRLAVVANTADNSLQGDPSSPEACWIAYPESGGDDRDNFLALIPFEVTCPCSNRFEGVLQRVHGVTQFLFEHLPGEVRTIEVGLTNVASRAPLAGEPSDPREAVRRIGVAEMSDPAKGGFVVGTFPTPAGLSTAWHLKLYGDDAEHPIFDGKVTDTLHVRRNRLLVLTARFGAGGQIDFDVELDRKWDGSVEIGGGDIR